MQLVLDRVNYIPVHILLKKITYSCDNGALENDSDWHYMMQDKTQDESFWALCEVIPRKGFRIPICINVDTRFGGGWSLGNGHHRLCAAILLGLDEIPVYLASDGEIMHSEVTNPWQVRLDKLPPYSQVLECWRRLWEKEED